MIDTITTSSIFLRLTFLSFNFFIATLRELSLLLVTPFGTEFRTRWWFTVDETEGIVVIGGSREGIVESEIESGIGGVSGSVLVVEITGPIGDST
jgi:hypothetical protein